MKSLVQFLLSILRYLGIDVYQMYIHYLERRMWRRAYPKDGNLRTDGLCLAFDVFQLTSFSQVGRDFADKLRKTSIPFEIFNTEIRPFNPTYIDRAEQAEYRDKLVTTIHQRNVLVFTAQHLSQSKKYSNLMHPVWEFESGFEPMYPDTFKDIKGVFTFSDFCTSYFSSIAPKQVPVFKIPFPFPLFNINNAPRNITRNNWGFSQDDFIVFFNFSFGSCYERKNPETAIDAFVQAFPNEKNTKLVIKTAHSAFAKAKLEALMKKITDSGQEGRVIIVDKHMPHVELLNLIAASDVYLSLHRGEGMGLGMLEAMAVGTPVICTNYGGNTDFCKPNTAFLVDYSMVPVKTDLPLYRYVKEWADPDVSQAASYLRLIYERPELGRQKAKAATAFINDYYDTTNFGKEVHFALKKIMSKYHDCVSTEFGR